MKYNQCEVNFAYQKPSIMKITLKKETSIH